jgi:carbamoyl-phosphate synthase large subunit
MTGRAILDCRNGVELLVQEICRPPEITIEIFRLPAYAESICRERIKTNTVVCTKTRVFKDEQLHQLVLRIIENESWPVASCIQIMRNHRDELAVIDVNLRIGAGTAMSAAVGWDLVSALLAAKLDLDPRPARFLNFDGRQRHVVRVYEEFVTD